MLKDYPANIALPKKLFLPRGKVKNSCSFIRMDEEKFLKILKIDARVGIALHVGYGLYSPFVPRVFLFCYWPHLYLISGGQQQVIFAKRVCCFAGQGIGEKVVTTL